MGYARWQRTSVTFQDYSAVPESSRNEFSCTYNYPRPGVPVGRSFSSWMVQKLQSHASDKGVVGFLNRMKKALISQSNFI